MSKRPKRKVNKMTEVPVKLPRNWAESEIKALLHGLMQYGHKNLGKIQTLLPGRSTECIKTFIRSAHDRATKLSEKCESVDPWIDHCSSSDGSPWADCLQVAQVLKYLSVDGLLENHPLPSSCGGIDFKLAYRLIYQAVMGYPIQPVNSATAEFVMKTLTELSDEVKEQATAIKNVELFLKSKVKSKDPDPEVMKPNSVNDNPEENFVIKKPVRVYQRKKLNVVNAEVAPSLRITVEEKGSSSSNSGEGPSKNFRITVEGNNSSQSTTVNVPVPSQKEVNEDEEELIKSSSYNPFQIPGKWLEEPLQLNLIPNP